MKRKIVYLLALCAAFVLTGCGATKIDLNEYLDVDYDGVHGYATATYEIDYEELITDYEEIFGFDDDDLIEDEDGQEFYLEVVEAVAGGLNKTENLENGDELVFEWDLDVEDLEEDYKVKFVYAEYTEVVEDLDELKEVDAFKGVEIKYDGPSGFAYAWLDTSMQEYYQFYYNVNLEGKFSNGDKITVTLADGYMDSCIQAGIVPKETSKTYTVSGLQELEEFDAFLGLKVEFTGTSPFGYVNWNDAAVKYDELYFEMKYDENTSSGNLANGDVITMMIPDYCVQKIIDRYGAVPAELTKTYEVSGLDTLVMNFEDVADDKWLELYNSWATTARTNIPANWEDPTDLVGVTYIGRSISRPTLDNWNQSLYYITLFYEVTVQQEGQEPFNYYYYYELEGLKKTADGTISQNNYSEPYGYVGWWPYGDVFSVNDLYYIGYQTFDEVYEKIIINDRSNFNTEGEFIAGYEYVIQ